MKEVATPRRLATLLQTLERQMGPRTPIKTATTLLQELRTRAALRRRLSLVPQFPARNQPPTRRLRLTIQPSRQTSASQSMQSASGTTSLVQIPVYIVTVQLLTAMISR